MVFSIDTYTERRQRLRELVGGGLIVLPGNNDSPMNYPANAYKFRQDSTFLYFFGQTRDGLVGVIDCDSGLDWLVGDDIDIDDIIWYGTVQSVADMAIEVGAAGAKPMAALADMVAEARQNGREVHVLPPYRYDTKIMLADLLDTHPLQVTPSQRLTTGVVELRSVKSLEEIEEIEAACAIGYMMHTTAMRLCVPGLTEQYVAGVIGGIAASYGCITSFQSIVTQHGEVMHGYPSNQPLEAGRLFLVDAGAETNSNYCSDHTRTSPVGGKFTQQQREIHDIVADCHDLAMQKAKPGVKYLDVHLDVCRLMTDRLKALGLMRGDTEEAVRAGAHALFLPHGLGHMMGMDVHDMEGLGQQFVGYDAETRPSSQFGLASLRMGRRLQKGFVVTDEPGIYFIPALIDLWRAEGKCAEFLCFDKIEQYKDFGGIRIEDDILITADGCRPLGEEKIPYRAAEVEEFIRQQQDED
ncbi:MAG: aminopeptidase P N-terminal domain-containing protein [Bacteroidaceae bacterium]|nr:aminopeptidase P N-terminal domain-containing protein [Bacteroidaceae bacterium]